MAASQSETLKLFTALRLLRPSWGGALLLGIGLEDTGRALALASLGAGAASLFLEPDPVHLRAAQREGCCTFAVTTLDEALRALKNEVRQGRAISVALSGDPRQWLTAMVKRGVQPEAFASAMAPESTVVDTIFTLQARGAMRLGGFGLAGGEEDVEVAEVVAQAAGGRWHITEDTAATVLQRREQDAVLMAAYVGEEPMAAANRRWLSVANSLFPRGLGRAHWQREM